MTEKRKANGRASTSSIVWHTNSEVRSQFDRRKINYCYYLRVKMTYLFWTLWCAIRARSKRKLQTRQVESREWCEHARDNLTTRQRKRKTESLSSQWRQPNASKYLPHRQTPNASAICSTKIYHPPECERANIYSNISIAVGNN